MDGESDRHEPSGVSAIDPISTAVDWTTQVLFRPFRIEKWMILGFCAWLASLAQGGCGHGSSSVGRGGNGRDFQRGFHELSDWVLAHVIPIVTIGAALIVLAVLIWLVLLWLSSRGKFMFLDGVVHDRAEVVAPWHRFRAAANALFGLRVVVGLIVLAGVLSVLAVAASMIWAHVETDGPKPLLFIGLALAVLLLISIAIVATLAELVVNDFLVPLMYLRGPRVAPAWREFVDLLSARPGAFVAFVVVKVFVACVAFAVTILACCMTCCIVLIPYIGTVILLPLFVFLRAYPVCFLAQFGPRYSRFATLGPAENDPEADGPSGGASPTRPVVAD